MKSKLLQVMGIALLSAAGNPLHASELVYVPFNPSFGGNPLNGTVLLNSAQATKRHEEDRTASGSTLLSKSPLQSFNESLERAILSRLASAATSEIFNDQGALQPGTVETANFTIVISDLGNGALMITTTDRVTGASTSFQVSQ